MTAILTRASMIVKAAPISVGWTPAQGIDPCRQGVRFASDFSIGRASLFISAQVRREEIPAFSTLQLYATSDPRWDDHRSILTRFKLLLPARKSSGFMETIASNNTYEHPTTILGFPAGPSRAIDQCHSGRLLLGYRSPVSFLVAVTRSSPNRSAGGTLHPQARGGRSGPLMRKCRLWFGQGLCSNSR